MLDLAQLTLENPLKRYLHDHIRKICQSFVMKERPLADILQGTYFLVKVSIQTNF